jgi:hypothetical protein
MGWYQNKKETRSINSCPAAPTSGRATLGEIMKDMTVGEFCRKCNACKEGREWAYKQHPLKSKAPMSEIYPLLIDAPDESWMSWVATLPGVLSYDVVREFSRWCALQVVHLWDAPTVTKWWIKTGNENLIDASASATYKLGWDSSWSHAWNAALVTHESNVRYAAFAAARCSAYYITRDTQNKKLLEYGNPFLQED